MSVFNSAAPMVLKMTDVPASSWEDVALINILSFHEISVSYPTGIKKRIN